MNFVYVLSSLSCVQLPVTLWTVALQAPLSMGFSRQKYQSGLSFPSPGDLPDPGIKPAPLTSPALARGFFTTSATWEAQMNFGKIQLNLQEQLRLMQQLGFPGGSTVKNLPAMQETQFRLLGQEDPLQKGMATYSRILDEKIPWTEEPARLQSMGSQRVGHD